MILNLYHSQVLRYGNLCHQQLNLPIFQKNLKRKLNPGSQKIVHANSVKLIFIKQVPDRKKKKKKKKKIGSIQKYFLKVSFSTIAYDFITNTLYYHGNDKDDNVSFYYSGDFLILLLLSSLLIMMEILNDFLRVGNICNLYYFYTIDFLICIFFVPFSHQRL